MTKDRIGLHEETDFFVSRPLSFWMRYFLSDLKTFLWNEKKKNFKIGSGVKFLLFSLSICNFEIKEVILDFKLALEVIQFEGFELKIMRN